MVRRNTIILNTLARAMNAGGCVLVSALDAGASAFNCTMSALSPGEKAKLVSRIKAFEKKVQELSIGIARETARYPDPAAALASESVIATINSIKELNKEIELMKQRVAELDAVKTEKKQHQDSAGVSGCIVQSLSGILPGEKATLQRTIGANEKKIQTLYSDFAREAAKQADPSAAMTSATVTGIVTKINELKSENNALKTKITDLSKPKADKPKAAAPAEKKAQPESAGVGKFFIQAISNTISGYLPGEKSNIERTLAENEKKIQSLYVDVAKESAKFSDPADALTAAPVLALLAKIHELKAANDTLKQQKAELSVVKKTEKPQRAVVADKSESAPTKKREAAPVSIDSEATADSSTALPETETAAETCETVISQLPDDSTEAAADSGTASPETETAAETCETVNSQLPVDSTGANADSGTALPETETAAAETCETVNSQLPDDSAYESDRIKPCTIPVPTLQPPTKEDIEAAIRDIQAADAQKTEDGELATEEPDSAAEAEGTGISEEAEGSPLETQEAAQEPDVETAPVDAADTPETVVTPDTADSHEALAEAVESEDAVTAPAEENIPETSATEENPNVIDETAVTGSEPGDESSNLDAALEPPPAIPVDDAEELAEAEGTVLAASPNDSTESIEQENSSESEGTDTTVTGEAVDVPQEGSDSSAETTAETALEETTGDAAAPAAPEVAADSEVAAPTPAEVSDAATPATEENKAAVTAVRAGFLGTLASRPDTFFTDKSEPVFRTRVYRNEFSILVPEPIVQKSVASEVVEESADSAVVLSAAEEISEQQKADIVNDASETAETNQETASEDAEEISDGEESETSLNEDEASAAEQSDTDDATLQKRQYARRKAVLSEDKGISAPFGKDTGKKRK